MDQDATQDWLDRYVEAWMSYDPDALGGLFGADVEYRYHPYDDPVVGRAAVVSSWLGEGHSPDMSTRDEPGTYDSRYAPYAVEGNRVVATGTSVYRDHPDGPVVRTFHNCFLMRFDADGRCVEFTEIYMQKPRFVAQG